jgi:hypothetical protein
MNTTSIGDILEGLCPSDLRISPALAYVHNDLFLSSGAPSNQQIIDATKSFYAKHQKLVDQSTLDTDKGAKKHSDFVQKMNSYNWKNQQLTQNEQDTTFDGIGLGGNSSGIWDNTLDKVKASQLFTTIGVGVNADLQFFVGGAGGLGCMFDIAKRESPKGYGYATGEAGLRITSALNVQCLILNQLPSAVNYNIYGLKVSLDAFYSLAFQVFFMPPGLTVLGYAIGAGAGLGGGATVFGGHIWHFG